MSKFIISLDEVALTWLNHISQVTGESVEDLIVGGIYRQVAAVEDEAYRAFGVRESAE